MYIYIYLPNYLPSYLSTHLSIDQSKYLSIYYISTCEVIWEVWATERKAITSTFSICDCPIHHAGKDTREPNGTSVRIINLRPQQKMRFKMVAEWDVHHRIAKSEFHSNTQNTTESPNSSHFWLTKRVSLLHFLVNIQNLPSSSHFIPVTDWR